MAYRGSKGIRGVEVFFRELGVQNVFQHPCNLLLGGIAVACYGLLDLFGHVFGGIYKVNHSSRNRYPLRTA